jgi:hypothetical protein
MLQSSGIAAENRMGVYHKDAKRIVIPTEAKRSGGISQKTTAKDAKNAKSRTRSLTTKAPRHQGSDG